LKILVLGISGMLGNAVFSILSEDTKYLVFGTARTSKFRSFFNPDTHDRIICGLDVLDQDSLLDIFSKIKPDIVINCIGIIKQVENISDPLSVLPINSILPHRLTKLCELAEARLILVSTDCVYSGNTGMYRESSESDAKDLYGKSKYIGESHNNPYAITLRTSIIGHELSSSYALIDWFLSQENKVKGYSKAIFSGLTTFELAKVMRDYVIPNPELFGLYHVSLEPIDKMSLLKLVADVYKKNILIVSDDQVCIDRSLDSSHFRKITGYIPPTWAKMINEMYGYKNCAKSFVS
jgi:dTDP-4-dehydrorhamnose reductase